MKIQSNLDMNPSEQAIQKSRQCNQIPYQYDLVKFRADLISSEYRFLSISSKLYKTINYVKCILSILRIRSVSEC